MVGAKPDLVSDINYRDFTYTIQKRGLQLLFEKLVFAIKHAGEKIDMTVKRLLIGSEKKRVPYKRYADANELIVSCENVEGYAVELEINTPHGSYVEISHDTVS